MDLQYCEERAAADGKINLIRDIQSTFYNHTSGNDCNAYESRGLMMLK